MTVRFKNELVRNITIKLGYANAKVRRSWCLLLSRLIRSWVDLRLRKRGLPTARKLPLVSFRQGGHPTVRAADLRTPHETRPPRLLCGLPRSRHPDGNDAQRRGGDGRRASPDRRERDVPATANVRTSGGGGDYEARTPNHSSKQS